MVSKIIFIVFIVSLVLVLGMGTVFAENVFLPDTDELPDIRIIYEDGDIIYQGARVTLYSDFFLPSTLEVNEKIFFQWYENNDDSSNDGIKLEHQMGNTFIVDTSRIGTYYYYYEITYQVDEKTKETVFSSPICITVEKKKESINPLSTKLTPAEESGWRRTTSSAEVVEFCEMVTENSDGRIKMKNLGYTKTEENEIPMLIMSYPEAPSNPDKMDPNKAVVLINCNIHSGEVEGKESMLIFAREVALGQHDELLKDLVVLVIPNFNADGNDLLAKNRINTQYTPKLVGTRFTGALKNSYVDDLGIEYNPNSEAHNFYNINRDMTKLDTVEARAVVNLMNEWDPVIFIDAHATNGSYMQHAVSYNWGLHPNTDSDIMEYNRDVFCKNAIGENSYLYKKQGKTTVPYGNFVRNNVTSGWTTFEDYPRYTTNYAGLRNRLALLLEVYSHDPYTVRVDTQYGCIYGSLLAVQEDKAYIKELIAQADTRSLARAINGSSPNEKVALNSKLEYLYDIELMSYASDPETNTIIWFEMKDDEGDRCGTLFTESKTYTMPYNGKFVPSAEEDMGAYYLIDSDCSEAIELLNYHGIEYHQLKEPFTFAAGDFQWYDIEKRGQVAEPTSLDNIRNYYEGHLMNKVTGSWKATTEEKTFPSGTYVVSTAQSRGALAALLLEPACVDGLVSWNFFDNNFNVDNQNTMRYNYPCTTNDEQPSTIAIPIFKVATFDEKFSVKHEKTVPFIDVNNGDRFYQAIDFVFSKELFMGTSETTFSPNATMTRSMMVTVLWRLANKPDIDNEKIFDDVFPDDYYSKPTVWAYKNGIIPEDSTLKFAPDNNVTREYMAVILYNYAKFMGYDVSATTSLNDFIDRENISSGATTAMQWAVSQGFIGGIENNMLNPTGNITRGEGAMILLQFMEGKIK